MDQPNHITDPQTDPEAAPDPDDDTGAEDQADEDGDGEGTNLLALNEILPFSQYRLTLSEFDRQPSDRVQFALDCALIAAAERVSRILRSDLSADTNPD
ncbi:MAG: hypothetical protein ACXWPK_00185 [Isosphaeraceae bacterium]